MYTRVEIQDYIDNKRMRDVAIKGLKARYNQEAGSYSEPRDPKTSNGIPVYARVSEGTSNVNHRLHVPFDRMITTQKSSYFASNVKCDTLEVGEPIASIYEDLFEDNSLKNTFLNCAEKATDMGTSYLLLYATESDKIGVTVCDPEHTLVIYDDLTGEPRLGIRYFEALVEVYDGIDKEVFERTQDGSLLSIRKEPHLFGTISNPSLPIVELANNDGRLGNVELTLSLQDAFDIALSDLSSEIAQMRLAYLVLKGLGGDDDIIKQQLKKAGVILLDSGEGSAEFVNKDMKVEGIKLLLEQTRELIFEGASSYDPDAFTSGSSPTAYQVNQRLHPLEQDAEKTIGEWEKGLHYFDVAIKNFLTVFHKVADYDTNDLKWVFTRNTPKNALGILKEAKESGAVIANDIILRLSGLTIDLEENKVLLKTQGDMYGNRTGETGA